MPPALPRPPISTCALTTQGSRARRRRRRLLDRRRRARPSGPARRGGRTAACPGTRGGPSAAADSSPPPPAGRRTGVAVTMLRADAAPQGSHLRHVRRLRHADRLGDRRLRRLRQGGREGRLHALARRADPALPPDPAGDQGRLLRALRRGPAPHRGPDLQAARLAARAVALRLPARLGQALAAVQGDQHAARPLRQEVRDRARSRTSTTSCSARRGATSRPTSTSS